MRALILSANTGEGHNSSAKAIKEVFDQKGDFCTIEDGFRLFSERISRSISQSHVFIYRKIPWLFNWGYSFAERRAAYYLREGSLLNRFFSKCSDELRRCIVEGEYDTVICVHPLTAVMLTEAQKRYPLPIHTAFVATDYTCSPGVKESNLDLYFIPDESLFGEFVCENISDAKLISSGIPIRQMFYANAKKDEAKKKCGVPLSHRHMVMACGSMGCGPIEKLAGNLIERLKENFTLTVVCGTNEKLKKQLEKKYKGQENLQIKGFVGDMSLLLDSADVYLTKSGGISATEAAAKNIPMVFVNAVAGCEAYNCDFFVKQGGALSEESIEKLTETCVSLLKSGEVQSKMRDALAAHNIKNAAETIFSSLKSF